MFSVERVVFEKEDFKKIGIEKEVRYVGHFSTSNLYGWGSFEYSCVYESIFYAFFLDFIIQVTNHQPCWGFILFH